MYTLNEFDVLDLIDQAVAFGVNAWSGKKEAMSLQIANFWLEGYIAGNNNLTDDDRQSLRVTMRNYCFI